MITRTRYFPSLWNKLTNVPTDLSVTLIGMPGSGKSYWANRLSAMYRRRVLELDEHIERKAGRSLLELTAEGASGERLLSFLEDDVMRGVMKQHMRNQNNGVIVSPGGSCVHAPCAREFFGQRNNLVVYLDVPFEVLAKRTMDFTNRGIVFGDHTPHTLKAERDILYRKFADVQVTMKADNAKWSKDLMLSENTVPAKDVLDYVYGGSGVGRGF